MSAPDIKDAPPPEVNSPPPEVNSPPPESNNPDVVAASLETNNEQHEDQMAFLYEDGVLQIKTEEEMKPIWDEIDSKVENQISSFSTIMNLLNSLLGAGILSVPSSFMNTGLIFSIFLLVLIAVLSYFAVYMLMKLQLLTLSHGYDELTYMIGGKTLQMILSILTLIFLVAALLAYIILGDDNIISWFALAHVNLKKFFPRALMSLIYSLLLPVALSIPRSLKFLSYFSAATVFFILLYVIAMIVKGIQHKGGNHPTVKYAIFNVELFYAISIFGLAFSLPITTLPIINPFKHDMKARNFVGLWAEGLCLVLIVVPSTIAYLIFGSTAEGNILNSFDDNDVLFIIVRIGFFLIVTFSYPCISQAVMGSWSQLIYNENDSAALDNSRRLRILLVTHSIPVVIAMLLPQAKPVLAVGGAIGGCLIDFCYPAILWIIYYRLKYNSVMFWLCAALCAFGFVSGVISTVYAVIDMIDAFKNIEWN